MLVNKFTGDEATLFTYKYTKAFEEMAEELKNKNVVPSYMIENPIERAKKWIEEREETEKLQLQIQENKPLITFAETVLKSKDNILVRELSKLIQDQGIIIGEKKLYNKLREWKLVLSGKREPSQYAMNSKLFVVEENSVDTPYGIKLTQTMKVTPKGQIYIIERLKKESSLAVI